MRGSFNTTYDLWYGPSGKYGPANTLRSSNNACRLVRQNKITQEWYPFTVSQYWFTYLSPSPNAPTIYGASSGVVTTVYDDADRVAIPSGSAVAFVAGRPELIVPTVGGSYERSLLIPLPLPTPPVPPPPPPTPGITCATAVVRALGASGAGLVTSGGPVQWWRIPGGGSPGARWISQTYSPVPVPGIGVLSGAACGSIIAVAQSFVHNNCFQIIPTSGPDMWVTFSPPGAGSIGYTFTVQTTPC